MATLHGHTAACLLCGQAEEGACYMHCLLQPVTPARVTRACVRTARVRAPMPCLRTHAPCQPREPITVGWGGTTIARHADLQNVPASSAFALPPAACS